MYTEWLRTDELLKTLRNISQKERDKPTSPVRVSRFRSWSPSMCMTRAEWSRAIETDQSKIISIAYRKGAAVARLEEEQKNVQHLRSCPLDVPQPRTR
jgi:hypothetical protein